MQTEWCAGPDGQVTSWASSCMGEGSYGAPHDVAGGLVVECLSPFTCADPIGGPFETLELAESSWRRHVLDGHTWPS